MLLKGASRPPPTGARLGAEDPPLQLAPGSFLASPGPGGASSSGLPPPRHTVSLALTASASEPSAPSLLGLQHAACMLPGEIRPGWSRFSPRLLSDIAP